jgi:hypothetical protein
MKMNNDVEVDRKRVTKIAKLFWQSLSFRERFRSQLTAIEPSDPGPNGRVSGLDIFLAFWIAFHDEARQIELDQKRAS